MANDTKRLFILGRMVNLSKNKGKKMSGKIIITRGLTSLKAVQ